MNRLAAFLVLVLSVFALPAHAALVYDGWDTGPGGLSTPYPAVNPEVYAGLLEMNGSSGTILTMSNDRNTLSHSGDSWSMTIYTYDEVMHGAPVRFSPAQYARAGYILDGEFPQSYFQFYPSLRAVAEAKGNDALAQANTQVWDIMSSTSCPVTVFSGGCSESFDTFNWSQTMWVATPNGPGGDERLIIIPGQNIVLGSGTLGPVVPVPPAIWLLGSGLLGLVGVARKKHKAH